MMNEKEWADFFELVNGRKPAEADFQKALEAGEFQASPKVDSPQVNQAQMAQDLKATPAQEPSLRQPEGATPALSPQAQTSLKPQADQAPAPLGTGAQVPTSPQGLAQAPLASGLAPKPKTSPFKKLAQAFQAKGPKKERPAWLNVLLAIGLFAVSFLILLGLGIGGHFSQQKVTQKEINGDWELSETAYYDDGDWESYYKNGKFANEEDERASQKIKYHYFLSKNNGELAFYNYMTAGSDSLAFSKPEKPAVSFTIKKSTRSLEARVDDDYAYIYYPNQDIEDDQLSLDDYKIKYFIRDQKLTLVYYDHGKPYYKETYESLSSTQAKKAKKKAKDYYKDFETYLNDVYDYYYGDGDGDSGSDSDSDRGSFQLG